jgi:hypothetical protein
MKPGTDNPFACLRRVFLPPLSALVWLLAGAQLGAAASITLNEVQRETFSRLVRTDRQAGDLFRKLQQKADAALDDPPHPLERIQTAGKLESDPSKIESLRGLEDMKKLNALGYAYAVTGKTIYSGAARKTILAWARVNQPTGQPIDESKLEPLLFAYDLTRATFPAADRDVVEHWLRTIAQRELDAIRPHSVTASNNWNSHRLKNIGLIGFLLDDKALIDRAVVGFREQVAANLRPDGSSLDFHERDALHYHCFDLEPLLTLAIAGQQNGIDLYSYQAPNGASVPKSVGFLEPYCEGRLTHPEWVGSKVRFDRERATAGEQKFEPGAKFNPREGLRTFELASFFDSKFKPLVCRLAGRAAAQYPTWQSLLNAACSR